MEPVFRRKVDGTINMNNTHAADRLEKSKTQWTPSISPEEMMRSAKQTAVTQGLDTNNKMGLLGCHTLQFGNFKGQTFRWVLENALGYAAFIGASALRESEAGGQSKEHPNHRANRAAFLRYMSMFPECHEAVSLKYRYKHGRSPTTTITSLIRGETSSTTTPSTRAVPSTTRGPTSTTTAASSTSTSTRADPSTSRGPASTATLKSLLVGKDFNSRTLEKSVKKLLAPPHAKFQPCKY